MTASSRLARVGSSRLNFAMLGDVRQETLAKVEISNPVGFGHQAPMGLRQQGSGTWVPKL